MSRRAPKYERGGVEGALVARFGRRLCALAAATSPASVLDAGCGEGVVTGWLADALPGARVAAVDARPDLVERARRRAPRAEVELGDVYALPHPDEAFDLVVCTEVLEHLDRPATALRELTRVARGHVLLTVPHEPFFRAGNLARGRHLRRLGSTPGHVQGWGRRGFLRLAASEAADPRWASLFPWQAVLARPRR